MLVKAKVEKGLLVISTEKKKVKISKADFLTYKALGKANDYKGIRAKNKDLGLPRTLEVDSKAKKAGTVKNTNYDGITSAIADIVNPLLRPAVFTAVARAKARKQAQVKVMKVKKVRPKVKKVKKK